MRVLIFGKHLVRIVLIFNAMFIAFSLIGRWTNGGRIEGSWFLSQYPDLLLWPTMAGLLAFWSLSICTINVKTRNRSRAADRVLRTTSALHYELVTERSGWAVFRIRSLQRRWLPGYEDTLLLRTRDDQFEITGYREDVRVIAERFDDDATTGGHD